MDDRVLHQVREHAFESARVSHYDPVAGLSDHHIGPVKPQGFDSIAQANGLQKELSARKIYQKQGILQLQLQAESIAQQAIQQRIRFVPRKIFAQAFRLQAQTGQRCFRIMSKCRKEFFDLRVTLLLPARVIKQSQSAANQ